ncbi:uncharacterized protein [Periplaneta americana]|uniref:uncharacterized protein isoform X2 n=1 Tax=Periplaneta americana TaxID=6978 RepID=UPI0037E7C16E
MDAIKTELEVDPLAVQSCDDEVKAEAYSSPDEGKLLNHHMSRIKKECVDDIYGHKSEIKFEEIILPNNFPAVKSETEEVNSLLLCPSQIKTEYEDHSYDLTSEMKCEGTSLPVRFPITKHEAEMARFDVMSRLPQCLLNYW